MAVYSTGEDYVSSVWRSVVIAVRMQINMQQALTVNLPK